LQRCTNGGSVNALKFWPIIFVRGSRQRRRTLAARHEE